MGGNIQIASSKCNFCIYLVIQVYYSDIQAITTFLCLLLVLYVLVPSIYSIFYLTTPFRYCLPWTELLQSPFRTEFSFGSLLWRYWRPLRHGRDPCRLAALLRSLSPSGIFLPGTELLQSPFGTEFSMGSRSRRYRRSLWRHRRFLRSYHDPWGYRRPRGLRCGDADRCATR